MTKVDPFHVRCPADGIIRGLDEHYDCMSDVENDPFGAWLAIQNLWADRDRLQKTGRAAAFAEVIRYLTGNKPDPIGNLRAQGYHAGWMDALAAVRKMARENEE